MSSSWSKNIAMYAASLLRLGNFVDAGFVAAILFETYIERELKVCGLKKSGNGSFLNAAIDSLAAVKPQKYNRTLLNELRRIRNNSIIHSDECYEHYTAPSKLKKIQLGTKKIVLFTWKQFDPERYEMYRQIEKIPHLEADFAVLAVREFFQNNSPEEAALQGTKIEEEDFNDLMHMRKHLLHFSQYLGSGVLRKYPNLEIDQISHTDTTSGYVWLAINHKRPHADHSRDRIRHSSASVIATPIDLRISIDFGGEAYLARTDYYKFIASKEYAAFVEKHPDLKLIDIEWYAFVTNILELQGVDEAAVYEMIDRARNRLEHYQSKKMIITWDRLLTGYITPKGVITYRSIANMLENIIELYFRFEHFRHEKLGRKNGLDWVPEVI